MDIVVAIKQVPETSAVKLDPKTGTIIREGVQSIINPLDLYAIESAIELAQQKGGKVTAISMGPPKAKEALAEAAAMGCDDAILLTDKAYAGSDTWATSYALAKAIEKLGRYDLILCGERATDGDTGQVGPAISAWLDIPIATYVSSILENKNNSISVKRLIEDGYETLQLETPCLLTVVKEISYPRLPTLAGKKRAKTIQIPVWKPEDIDAEINNLGLDGSPTKVVKIYTPKVTRNGEIVTTNEPEDIEKAADKIIDYLEKNDLL